MDYAVTAFWDYGNICYGAMGLRGIASCVIMDCDIVRLWIMGLRILHYEITGYGCTVLD